jgi:hypothetical protein
MEFNQGTRHLDSGPKACDTSLSPAPMSSTVGLLLVEDGQIDTVL